MTNNDGEQPDELRQGPPDTIDIADLDLSGMDNRVDNEKYVEFDDDFYRLK